MKVRDKLEEIASSFGLRTCSSWDRDIDIILESKRSPRGLKGELKKYGFRYFGPLQDDGWGAWIIHVHAPESRRTWGDKGWEWDLEETPLGGMPLRTFILDKVGEAKEE